MFNIGYLRSFIILLLFIVKSFNSLSQNVNNSLIAKSVKYIYQIPSIESKDKFSHKIVDIVLGDNKIEITKPVAVFSRGNQFLYVLDQGIQGILSYNRENENLSLLRELKKTCYSSLIGVCSISERNLLFTDSKLNKVLKYDFENQNVVVFNDDINLDQPTGIAYSKVTKEIWVVETHSHKISVFDTTGNLKREFGERGIESGQFNFPTYIWIDDWGTVYIIDALNFRLQIFNKNGEFLSAFGGKGNASGYFASPKGVATDSFGNIYVVDALFHTVQIFDKMGNFLYNFGNQGRGEGKFWLPTGIFIDNKDFIYVADSYNSRIQVFQLVSNE